MPRHALAVLLQVTGIDTLGGLHSRGGQAILAEVGDTAWRHIAPVIACGLTGPEPESAAARTRPALRRGCDPGIADRARCWLSVRCRVLTAAVAGRDPWALPG